MEVNIIKAEEKHFVDCVIALQKSELGRLHFSEENSAAKAINEGISKGEIFVAVTNEDLCVGFIWVVKNGAFHSFPYLHLIAVKEEYRNHGIGKKLLQYFEDTNAKKYSKLFLVVADFNKGAKRLYQSMGYQEVCVIPDLYKKGIAEYLMMKRIQSS
ncbi:GNAT family N-acetyltransferase [Ruminiclostridium josui]|uniref:GNAT family N-acetyltransferase n=1 Tax=Ruminiclostridium josui TaxID=1499 RepID=UPI000465BE75|nr:GNAT family N-acetyltransferase [Ruminiclostridium josui]